MEFLMDRKVLRLTEELDDAILKIKAAGGKTYIVGGWVRDYFIGRNSKDMDFCVTGIAWEEFEALFPDNKIQGISFPIFNIANCEFALARKERKVACGYHGFEPWVDKSLTIEDDLIRRDFTINAMAIDLETKELIDPHNGRKDIELKILRAVSDAFAEDPLRVYRGARLAAQLGFYVDQATQKMMTSLVNELHTISVDRVSAEVIKAIESPSPAYFFTLLQETNVLHIHFPELAALNGVPQPEKYHRYDALLHSITSLAMATTITTNPMYRYAALVHDLGKGLTPKELWPAHHGHEEAGIAVVEAMGERLKGIPKEWTKASMAGSKFHMKAYKWKDMKASTFVDMIIEVSRTPLGLEGLMVVINADHMSRGFRTTPVSEAYDIFSLGSRIMKEVTGRTITVKPGTTGKAFGEALRLARIEWFKTNLHVKVLRDYKEEQI